MNGISYFHSLLDIVERSDYASEMHREEMEQHVSDVLRSYAVPHSTLSAMLVQLCIESISIVASVPTHDIARSAQPGAGNAAL